MARIGLKAFLLAITIALAFSFCFGCSKKTEEPSKETPGQGTTTTSEEKVTINIMTLKGPTGVGMAKMMDDEKTTQAGDYAFTLVGSPDEVVAALTSGQVDMAAIPTNLAAKLYAKTSGDIRMIAINTFGSLYIVENGTSIKNIKDLAGKTIYATGQGSNPQYILEYLLTNAGLTIGKDVEVVYLSEHAELATLVAAGKVSIAMLPEPFVSTVTSKNADVHVALNFNELWREATSSELTMGCVVAKKSFIEEHPKAVASFLADLDTSIGYMSENVEVGAALCAAYGIIPDKNVAQAAIPNCGLTFISGSNMKPALANYFKVLLSADPASLGGAIPDDSLYYAGS